jgi:hypothetical protein
MFMQANKHSGSEIKQKVSRISGTDNRTYRSNCFLTNFSQSFSHLPGCHVSDATSQNHDWMTQCNAFKDNMLRGLQLRVNKLMFT